LHGDDGRTCLTYVDGTDCPIEEPPKTDNSPLPFDKKWYSHKFKGAGFRYEIASCIKTGDIVFVNGPFPCGKWPDLKIFRRDLKNVLLPNEKIEADRGYRGDEKVRTPDDWVTLSDRRAKYCAGARHETINGRLKNFKCLSTKFRHELSTHKHFFCFAVVVTQLMFEYHGTTFEVRY
jgi:hypothetical protein